MIVVEANLDTLLTALYVRGRVDTGRGAARARLRARMGGRAAGAVIGPGRGAAAPTQPDPRGSDSDSQRGTGHAARSGRRALGPPGWIPRGPAAGPGSCSQPPVHPPPG
jgi:hypothetical protein